MSPQPDFSLEPGTISEALNTAVSRLDRRGFCSALWSRRLDVWTDDPAVQAKIANRLGWLNAVDVVAPQLIRVEAFAENVRASGLSDVVLLGMGGSSLAPEVLRRVLGRPDRVPRFRMLDSTDPAAVREALEHAATSLFVIASKSGTTIEPNSMAAEARRRLQAAGVANWGSRFVAITDTGTELHQRGLDHGFLEVFLNPSDIGGRYSALSLFGMVPAALMGIALPPIVQHARTMADACRTTNVTANPGIALGALMGAAAKAGRDKLTVMLPARLESVGLWIEQLVAESTGKENTEKQQTGIVPIVGDTAAAPIGDDRSAVIVRVAGDGADEATVDRMRAAGVPLMTIDVPDVMALGAEFLRWEIATATAGWLLGVNPFDEPNVQEAKRATGELLDAYVAHGTLPLDRPDAVHGDIRFTLSQTARRRLAPNGVGEFVNLIGPGDYFALLVYAPPDHPSIDPAVRALGRRVAGARGCATMVGYGPRYLHSTGQLHKGGTDNGVFLIVTGDTDMDLDIPEAPYSFGVLEISQALGDCRSLDKAGRRVLHAHLPRVSAAALERLANLLTNS